MKKESEERPQNAREKSWQHLRRFFWLGNADTRSLSETRLSYANRRNHYYFTLSSNYHFTIYVFTVVITVAVIVSKSYNLTMRLIDSRLRLVPTYRLFFSH